MAEGYIQDISMDFSEHTAVYPGDPAVSIDDFFAVSKGDVVNVSQITFGSHTGTHIDAPQHFFMDGISVDELPLEHFIGRAKVFALTGRVEVTADDLAKLPIEKGDILLLKTDNSAFVREQAFREDYTYIRPDAAAFLAEKKIATVGFDYLSVERFGSADFLTHRTLLGNGIVIIEGLCLAGVEPGEYELSALPIKITGGNGSPVRAVLMKF